jgi:dihydrofolate reductase
MRKIKLFIASSLDGYIATEDGSIDWLYTDSDYGYTQFYNSVDTILMGRKTYDKIIELAAEYPHKDKKNYVFSQKKSAGKRTEKEKDHNVEFIADIIDSVKIQLLQSQGKDIWLIGGADIISIFLNAGMLDEIILSIHPIVLGKGIPLFRNLQRQMNLKL